MELPSLENIFLRILSDECFRVCEGYSLEWADDKYMRLTPSFRWLELYALLEKKKLLDSIQIKNTGDSWDHTTVPEWSAPTLNP